MNQIPEKRRHAFLASTPPSPCSTFLYQVPNVSTPLPLPIPISVTWQWKPVLWATSIFLGQWENTWTLHTSALLPTNTGLLPRYEKGERSLGTPGQCSSTSRFFLWTHYVSSCLFLIPFNTKSFAQRCLPIGMHELIWKDQLPAASRHTS